mgnify:CR=1 FL=1
MAKSDVVVALLATAVALAETNNDVELADGIEMLEALGDDAKGNTQEYKDLKEVVENIENGLNGDGSEIEDEDEKARLEAEAQEKARLEAEADGAKNEKKSKKAKKYNLFGIKQIGGLWYSEKDAYKTGFKTVEECAIKHNSK